MLSLQTVVTKLEPQLQVWCCQKQTLETIFERCEIIYLCGHFVLNFCVQLTYEMDENECSTNNYDSTLTNMFLPQNATYEGM